MAKKPSAKAGVKKPAAKKTAAKKPATSSAASATAVAEPVALSVFGKARKGIVPVTANLALKQIRVIKGFNPRTEPGDVSILARTIKDDGLLNFPVVAPGKKAGEYDLVAGERRIVAVASLGWTELAVQIRPDLKGVDAETMLRRKAVAVAENSEDGRINLNAIEIGRVCAEMKKKGWTPGRISKEMGVHEQKVRRCLRLMEAPKDVQAQVETGEVSTLAAIEVAKLDDKTRKAISTELHTGISAAEVRKLAKTAAKAAGATTTDGKDAKKKKGAQRDAALAAWKGSKAKQAIVRQFCYYLNGAEGDEVGTTEYHELRGAIGAILWDRGDLESPVLPSMDPSEDDDPKASAKLAKAFNKIVASEAAKYEPPEEDGEEE